MVSNGDEVPASAAPQTDQQFWRAAIVVIVVIFVGSVSWLSIKLSNKRVRTVYATLSPTVTGSSLFASPSVPPTLSFVPSTSSPPSMELEWTEIGNYINGGDNQMAGSAVALSNGGTHLWILSEYYLTIPRLFVLSSDKWREDYYRDFDSIFSGSGHSMAVTPSGDVLVVGSTTAFDLFGEVAVIERVWNVDGESFSWRRKGLSTIGRAKHDSYGSTVDVTNDGSVIAVGTDRADYVLVFRFEGEYDNNDEAGGDWSLDADLGYGRSLSLLADGTGLVVGAPGEDEGQAIVYDLSSSNKSTPVQRIRRPGSFGHTVSLSENGSTIAVGSFRERNVHVFRRRSDEDGFYVQFGDALKFDNPFGISVVLSGDGNRLVVGISGRLNFDSQIFVYAVAEENEGLDQIREIFRESTSDKYGLSVALSNDGKRIAIGASFTGGSDRGQVRVYEFNR